MNVVGRQGATEEFCRLGRGHECADGLDVTARKSWKERTNFGSGEAFEDHADWMRRASRISTGERPAGRGVERLFAGWFGSADVGRTVQKTGDMLECLI